MWTSIEDWARVGEVLRNGGLWNGQQVVPVGWVAQMLTPSAAYVNYGMMVWLGSVYERERFYDPDLTRFGNHHSEPFAAPLFYLDGLHVQRVWVVPSKELVIVRTGLGDPAWDESRLPNLLIPPYAEWYQNSLRIKGSSVDQYHTKTYGKDFRYEQFAPMFNEQLKNWDPDSWAELFSNSGARYVVLVTRHHDGFLMWNSKHPNPRNANWQATRDIAGELNQAVSAKGMKMRFYYSSLLDWSFTKALINSLAELIAGSDTSRDYLTYIENHWRELIERYDPWILWSEIGYPPGFDLNKLFLVSVMAARAVDAAGCTATPGVRRMSDTGDDGEALGVHLPHSLQTRELRRARCRDTDKRVRRPFCADRQGRSGPG